MSKFQEFKDVIHEIFEIDKSELDFGIYRILNQKSKEIQKFINEDLKPQVEEAFSKIEKENRDSQENEVFSALANFFKRYYEGGDFISKRRYKDGVYAIPYNGEEVKLYWANYDQYYIKTTENLSNFAFYSPSGKKVNFQILEASVSKDNNKTSADKERIFVLHKTEKLRTEGNEIFIPFEYALVDKKEKGKDSAKTLASQILKSKEAKDFDPGLSQLFPTDKNKDRTLLEKRIEEFTARYNFDYFIHKNLGGFLRRELDFFIKNEILYLEDLEEQDSKSVQSQITKVKTIKTIGEKIIAFLEQVENFQKKLWLKKKFITETNYCITIDRIPKSLYAQILENKEQLAEWERNFSISERKGYTKQLKLEFLENNENLVLDTKYFSEEFKQNLLASIPNFDESCNGLLINSENFQALNQLQKRYKESIKCIHIDPPYNTDTSGFLYKNNYKHSSWLAMKSSRINSAIQLLEEEGLFLTHIDENEMQTLSMLFAQSNLIDSGLMIWNKGAPVTGSHGLAYQHEYVLFNSKKNIKIKAFKKNIALMKEKALNLFKEYKDKTKINSEWRKWIKNQIGFSKSEIIYDSIDEEGKIYRSADMTATDRRKDPKFHIPLIHPVSKKPCPVPENGWRYSPETLEDHLAANNIIFGDDHSKIPRRKVLLDDNESSQLPSVYYSGLRGKLELDNLNLFFPFAHSTDLYQYLIEGISEIRYSTILDYFAGSGTTGHAVINLNREDGGNRKYILVEMGEYFETVLKPRIQKVIYAAQWKDGKPQELGAYIDKLKKEKSEFNKELNNLMGFQSQEEYEYQKQRLSGAIASVDEQISNVEEDLKLGNSFGSISHCFKYIRLESYEDALNNLVVEEKLGALDFSSREEKQEIMLKYVLDLETQNSQSLLNLEAFASPFSYSMQILENGTLKKKNMDLVETFHYLLGVAVARYHAREEVKTDKVSFLVQCVEGELRTGEIVLIVWRIIPSELGVANKELKVYLESKFKLKDFDKLYINGDSIVEKAELLEAHFHKAMFDVKDI